MISEQHFRTVATCPKVIGDRQHKFLNGHLSVVWAFFIFNEYVIANW